MTDTELTILNYLLSSPEAWFGRREIARRAVKRSVYEENQHWADAPLAALVANKMVEVNDAGLYRYLKPKLFNKEEKQQQQPRKE